MGSAGSSGASAAESVVRSKQILVKDKATLRLISKPYIRFEDHE